MTTENTFRTGRVLQENPFAITKAVDFTDSEIDETWVDWPDPGGFADLTHVRSPMARIIKGGKGTGRTHVMRHFSAQVQAIRDRDDPLGQVVHDGVLGIYVRCSGLNSSRFRGRGIGDHDWQSIFVQYADIWLAQAALGAFLTATVKTPPSDRQQSAITAEVRELLHTSEVTAGTSLADLRNDLYDAQRRIDRAVSQAALTPGLPPDLSVQSVRGSLVFAVPTALQRHYDPLRNVTFLYLIDEFENFGVPQQQYVNSLVRERAPGTSFMIGVRTFGLQTLQTLDAGEENRRGSEFDEIELDRRYLAPSRRSYAEFCKRVVARRLAAHGATDAFSGDIEPREITKRLRDLFQVSTPESEEQLAIERYDPGERPYLQRLRRQLSAAEKTSDARLGIGGNVDAIVEAVRVPSRPLLEKVNIFLMYRAWARNKNLNEIAHELVRTRSSVDSSGIVPPNDAQRAALAHYHDDLRAQLCRDMRGRQTYSGIDRFIQMSDGLPRNLLVILKNIYRWAAFNGEQPFGGGRISLESQRLGVYEAAQWFLADAKPLGEDGERLQAAIHRLGEMFRAFRFSDKPVESSLASFSADLENCSEHTRDMVELAAQRALLIRVERGQKERNTGLVEPKFHLNRLLSPLWDLPTGRRGAVRLSADEVNAIFDPEDPRQFSRVVQERLDRMTAPFGAARREQAVQRVLDWDE